MWTADPSKTLLTSEFVEVNIMGVQDVDPLFSVWLSSKYPLDGSVNACYEEGS